MYHKYIITKRGEEIELYWSKEKTPDGNLYMIKLIDIVVQVLYILADFLSSFSIR